LSVVRFFAACAFWSSKFLLRLSGKVLWAADGLHFLANWFADLECWLSGHGTWDSLRAMRRRPPSTGRG
jgi:hypothetical protein